MQPAEDRWTTLHLSNLFLDQIKKVPARKAMLDVIEHYPIEQPGLRQMHVAIVQFALECADICSVTLPHSLKRVDMSAPERFFALKK